MSQAAAIAQALVAAGLEPGQRVAVMGSGVLALLGWMGTLLAGGVELPIHPDLRGLPLRHAFETGRPMAMIADCGLIEHLEETPIPSHLFVHGRPADMVPRPGAQDLEPLLMAEASGPPERVILPSFPAAVLFTSGTSGPAKGALLPHRQLCMVADQVVEMTGLNAGDIVYCAYPLNHVAGKYMCVFAAMSMGARVVVEKRFDPGVWLSRIRQYRATLSMAHGPMLEMIHAQPETPHDGTHELRRMMCCPLPRAIGAAFERRFNLTGIEMWGMTEIGNPLWTRRDEPRPAGSCGRLLSDWYDMAICDPQTDEPVPQGKVGEILVRPKRSFTSLLGYLGQPEATLASWRNLWFHSGDLAYADDQGNVFYVDRLGDRIRRRAENISSTDIESAALHAPGVAEAAAVGVPSGFEGDDDIKLFVVPQAGARLDPEAVLRHMAKMLPHYMLPRYIEMLAALPRTPTNKVRKKLLRETAPGAKEWDRRRAGLRVETLYPRS
ncbi:MAG: hypothetical protein ABS76_00680 [Pelagibacterium sp. SCN 64-44]|nr:MAG: hypothetical protein ABS76_00680 [Pelagibacterium sp. SCN 64-44]